MNGILLRFYLHETAKHRHRLLYEWLLEHARNNGIPGGSAFRAIAGFGRHGVMHAAHFLELATELTIVVEFVLGETEAERLLASLRHEKVELVYARTATEFGVLGKDEATSPPGPSDE